MTILAGTMFFLTGQGSSSWFQPRRTIQRATGGAMDSTMWGYYNYGEEKTLKEIPKRYYNYGDEKTTERNSKTFGPYLLLE
jgi:hypothetical protein